MKLFSWVHEKFNGKSQSNTISSNANINASKSNKNQTPQLGGQKEEFSDWPQGFLSIGTLFNKSSKDEMTNKDHSAPSQNNPILDFTLEEVKELQKELNAIMSSSSDLNCLSSFDEEDEKDEDTHLSSSNNVEEDEYYNNYQHDTMIVPNNKGNDIYLDNNNNGSSIMGKKYKSFSFLLKKMFICGVGGIGPTPSLRDPTLLAPKTSMHKILRAMLRKKVYPQHSSTNLLNKKYLGDRKKESIKYDNEDEEETDDDDDLYTEENNKIRWDKSDTEYIVLEI